MTESHTWNMSYSWACPLEILPLLRKDHALAGLLGLGGGAIPIYLQICEQKLNVCYLPLRFLRLFVTQQQLTDTKTIVYSLVYYRTLSQLGGKLCSFNSCQSLTVMEKRNYIATNKWEIPPACHNRYPQSYWPHAIHHYIQINDLIKSYETYESEV